MAVAAVAALTVALRQVAPAAHLGRTATHRVVQAALAPHRAGRHLSQRCPEGQRALGLVVRAPRVVRVLLRRSLSVEVRAAVVAVAALGPVETAVPVGLAGSLAAVAAVAAVTAETWSTGLSGLAARGRRAWRGSTTSED